MAQPVITTLGRWRAEGTNLGEVEAALARLARRFDRPTARTAVLNLVVLPAPGDDATAAHQTIRAATARHPVHSIVVETRPDGPPRLDADVRVHALVSGDATVRFQDVCLWLGGPAVHHVASAVARIAVAGVPLALWLGDRHEPVPGMADRVIVDGGVMTLDRLAGIARRAPVTDLSWVELTPWREQLAGLFEGVDFRPFLGGVRHVRVAGPDRPRSLLAGWLVSRLRLAHGAVELRVADQTSVELIAEHNGRMGRFAVGRPAGAPGFRAGVEIEGGPAHARTLPLRNRSRPDVFARALARSEADTVYEEALAAAIALSRKGRT